MNIGQVHLDDRAIERLERVEKGDRGMRVGGRVDDDRLRGRSRFVDPLDQLVFGVALAKLDGQGKSPPFGSAEFLNILQRFCPVDRRLATAKQVQIRAVQHEDRPGHATFRLPGVSQSIPSVAAAAMVTPRSV
jgi:hypothetical protein